MNIMYRPIKHAKISKCYTIFTAKTQPIIKHILPILITATAIFVADDSNLPFPSSLYWPYVYVDRNHSLVLLRQL